MIFIAYQIETDTNNVVIKYVKNFRHCRLVETDFYLK